MELHLVFHHGLAGGLAEHPEVGSQPGVGGGDVVGQQADLLDRGLIDEDRGLLLFAHEDDAILGLDACAREGGVPMAVSPLATALRAYSIWESLPFELKVVRAKSAMRGVSLNI